jgi:hypothetical protein
VAYTRLYQAHVLTLQDRLKGAAVRWQRHRERQEQIEAQAAEFVADEVVESPRTYKRLRDDPSVSNAVRLAAADRIVGGALRQLSVAASPAVAELITPILAIRGHRYTPA